MSRITKDDFEKQVWADYAEAAARFRAHRAEMQKAAADLAAIEGYARMKGLSLPEPEALSPEATAPADGAQTPPQRGHTAAVISFMLDHPGGIRAAELRQALDAVGFSPLHRKATSKILQRLRHRGLVVRDADADRWRLTPDGVSEARWISEDRLAVGQTCFSADRTC